MTGTKLPMHTGGTLEVILAAAAEEFAVNGHSGARMDAIARRAGVNKASIYYHLGGKDALYERVLVDAVRRACAILSARLDESLEPRGRIRAAVFAVLEWYRAVPHLGPIMLREMASGGAGMSEKVMTEVREYLALELRALGIGAPLSCPDAVSDALGNLLLLEGVFFFMAGESFRRRATQLEVMDFSSGFEPEVVAERVAEMIWRNAYRDAGEGEVEHARRS